MRTLILLGTLAAAAVVALPAQADGYLKIHGTRDNLTWHTSSGRALDLASPEGKGKGIRINRIEPAGHDGLRQGDVIVAANGQPVAHVVDLTIFANAHLQAAATCRWPCLQANWPHWCTPAPEQAHCYVSPVVTPAARKHS